MSSVANPTLGFDPSASGVSQSDYPAAYPDLNPLDHYRILVADRVATALEVDRNLVFSCTDRTTTLETGDLILAAPRLRLKGIPPSDLAEKIVATVRGFLTLKKEI